ncbi:Spo0B domain-containing protein [Sporosarcina sp. CAU 1771]
MIKRELKVLEALKFSHHDYLNDLQLILMYIDLGEPSKAKETIQRTTYKMGQLSKLSQLGLPATEQWIATFSWVYSTFETTVLCTVSSGNRKADDRILACYLDAVFSDLEDSIDPLTEYEAHFEVFGSQNEWCIEITINGGLNGRKQLPEADVNFIVEETILENKWKLTIRGN